MASPAQINAETFHVDAMLRADWQKRRLQRVEADLHRTLLAENPGASLAAALLSDPPPPNSSPACSARSPPSNAPGTAPIPNSAAPAARPKTPPKSPLRSTLTSSLPSLPPANWLRYANPQTSPCQTPQPPPLRPLPGRQPTRKRASLYTLSADHPLEQQYLPSSRTFASATPSRRAVHRQRCTLAL